MFTIPSFPYYIITEDPVYINIVWGLGNQFSGLQANIISNDFAALVSIPVRKFFE